MQPQHIRRWPPSRKAFLSTCCYKNESEIGFVTVKSSCVYQHEFSGENSEFLGNTITFCDCLPNYLLNFYVIVTKK